MEGAHGKEVGSALQSELERREGMQHIIKHLKIHVCDGVIAIGIGGMGEDVFEQG